jgi:hypothetical protein
VAKGRTAEAAVDSFRFKARLCFRPVKYALDGVFTNFFPLKIVSAKMPLLIASFNFAWWKEIFFCQ